MPTVIGAFKCVRSIRANLGGTAEGSPFVPTRDEGRFSFVRIPSPRRISAMTHIQRKDLLIKVK